ncbi:uncharacterized protein LOC142093606 isoform X1 [Calonectris borealis]|uniref:uncharacterized protein LOC142093606 isoform X1 n=1 Tax=Calonectris borealis TaxID=1323832 RepID=UPI003F4BC4E2
MEACRSWADSDTGAAAAVEQMRPGGGTDLLPEPTPPAAIRGSHRLLRGWEAALAVCRKERDYLIPTASEINPHYGFVPGEEETDFHSQPVLNRYLKVHAPIPGNVPPTIPVRKIVVTSAGPASLLSSSRVPPPNPGRARRRRRSGTAISYQRIGKKEAVLLGELKPGTVQEPGTVHVHISLEAAEPGHTVSAAQTPHRGTEPAAPVSCV